MPKVSIYPKAEKGLIVVPELVRPPEKVGFNLPEGREGFNSNLNLKKMNSRIEFQSTRRQRRV